MSNMVGSYEIGEASAPKKRSKLRSEVWEHFTKLDVDGGTRAKCKYCHTDLSYTMGTTSHLGRHLASCSEAPEQVGTQFSKKPKSKMIFEPLEKAKKQKSAGIKQPPTIALPEAVRNFDVTSEKIWEVQVKNAILADFPFAHPNIKKAWSSLMVMDMEKEICAYHQRQKEKLITELGDLTSGVSFSCEIIEAGWISISAHFINDDFKLVKRLIGFKKVDFETPNSCKADTIERCISDWKLEDKIFSINTKLNEDLRKLLKQKFSTKWSLEEEDVVFPCFRYLVATYYFANLRHNYSVEKDKIIKFFQNAVETKIKMSKFNAIAKKMGLSPIDEDWLKRQPIGWYWETQVWKICCSVVKLFKDALIYQPVIFEYALTITSETSVSEAETAETSESEVETSGTSVSEVDLQSIRWHELEKEVDYFIVLNYVMGALSTFKYPTSNLYFQSCTKLILYYHDLYYRLLCSWIPYIFYVSCVLDPRYKLKFLEYYFKQFEVFDGAHEKVSKTRELFETLFVVHARQGTNGGSSVSAGTADTQEDNSLRVPTYEDNLTKGFRLYLKNLKTIDRSEMNQYLIEDIVDIGDADFDVLEWWKENSLRYPVLSRMARTLLAVPVFVYSIEENLGLDLSVLKGSVDPELVEAAICSKDWILTNA